MAAEEGQVIGCHTVESWTEQIQKGNDPVKLVLVYFTASWCGPCRLITPFFTEMAKKYPTVLFLKVDVDELNSVATEWAVDAMPTFVFVKGGKIGDKLVGPNKVELEKKVMVYMDDRCVFD